MIKNNYQRIKYYIQKFNTKRILILPILCVALLSCPVEGNNCFNAESPETPTQPSSKPSVDVPDTPTKPLPKPRLEWAPFDLKTMTELDKKGLCAMLYFNSDKDDCDQCRILKETLRDNELISLINDAFVPVKFPVDKCLSSDECKGLLKNRLFIKTIPTTVFVFKDNEAISYYAEGGLSVNEFKYFLLNKEELYNSCKRVKGDI